jgi:hypothetical protein
MPIIMNERYTYTSTSASNKASRVFSHVGCHIDMVGEEEGGSERRGEGAEGVGTERGGVGGLELRRATEEGGGRRS